jgi:plastocyanin
MKSQLLLFGIFFLASAAGATIHTITNVSFSFNPVTLTVVAGDTIDFSVDAIHVPQEVSQATWNANGTTALPGGFSLPGGGGRVVLTTVGTHYYVCVPHVLFGMKGTITVNPLVVLPGSLTVTSMVDQDGNPSTAGDRGAKAWGLRIYKDFVSPLKLVASAASASVLTVDTLVAGTYVAVEDDSASWSHRAIGQDGGSDIGSTSNSWTLVVGQGESHSVEFLNYAPHIILSSGMTFVPDSLSIKTGDTVRFVLDPIHNALEVSQSSWLANDNTSNGGFSVPFGGGTVVFPGVGVVYYVCTVHAADGMKGRIFVIQPPVQHQLIVSLADGWNMISLPLSVSDSATTTLFPGAASGAFNYLGRYLPSATLTVGTGYWLKSVGAADFPINGYIVGSDTVTLLKGWNMIGSISLPVPVAFLQSVPPGIIASHVFGYHNAYTVADTIYPGSGYWVKLSQDGKIALDSVPVASALASVSTGSEGAEGVLRVTDNDGKGTTLMLRPAKAGAGERVAEDLPPLPPAGGFDARFSSNQRAEETDPAASRDFPLQITGGHYPIRLSWQDGGLNRQVAVVAGGRSIRLTPGESLMLSSLDAGLALRVESGSGTPSHFALERIYPNPFNPSVSIRYALPRESRVVIRIYNILGQQVALLADQVQPSGSRQVDWKPGTGTGEIASGLYVVSIEASPVADPAGVSRISAPVVYQK